MWALPPGHSARRRGRRDRIAVAFLTAAWLLAWPLEVGADLVFFHTGRTLSVLGHRVDGNRVIFLLRGGGEVECDQSLIARIAPDEVAHPEPAGTRGDTEATGHSDSLRPVADRPYATLIRAAAATHGVNERLVHAVVEVESSYRAGARSPKGARGLMQLLPATAAQYQPGDLYDPAANLDAGVRHLKGLLGRFDLVLALAAYNAGEAAVRRHGGVPPYPETQAYVRRVLSLLPGSSF